MLRLCTQSVILKTARKPLLTPIKRSFHWQSFRNNMNQTLDSMFEKVPYGIVPIALVGVNIFFYLLHLGYRSSNSSNAIKLEQSPVLSHFVHRGLFSLGINSFVTYSMCRYIEQMNGTPAMMKMLVLSFCLGSMTFQYLKERQIQYPPMGNDVLIRGLAFAVIIRNPQATFYLIPLPIPIKAWIAGAIGIFFDVMAWNLPGMAGVLSGIIAAKIF